MSDSLPDILKQGEPARLFPVLSDTSKEGRTTSIVLACLSMIDEFGRDLLKSAAQRVGSRSTIETWTEVVPKAQDAERKDRPDGLIALRVGSRVWHAFVEAKVGNALLEADQVERYRSLAKEVGADCVITISNQFATVPTSHPLPEVRKSRSKIPVVHWSWMHILTTADLLINRNEVDDRDQLILLNELRRFLTHESAGVKGFSRMPKAWAELNKLVASGGTIIRKSEEAVEVVEAWHQETRDLSLILSRLTQTGVTQKLPRAHLNDQTARLKSDLECLCTDQNLVSRLDIPDAAAPLDVVVDLSRRAIDVGMTLRAPEDKKSTKARVNWLLRQIKTDALEGLIVRLNWPGRSPQTQATVEDLRVDPDAGSVGKEGLVPISFEVASVSKLGGRFAQPVNFIADIERCVPDFYRDVGANLKPWQRPAPRIKKDRDVASDVGLEGLADEANDFDPE